MDGLGGSTSGGNQTAAGAPAELRAPISNRGRVEVVEPRRITSEADAIARSGGTAGVDSGAERIALALHPNTPLTN